MKSVLSIFILLVSFSAFANPQAKTFEVRISPLALLAKWYTVEAAYKMTDNFDFGFNYTSYRASVDYGGGSMFIPTREGSSYGINGNYYLSHRSDTQGKYVGFKFNRDNYTTVGHASHTVFDEDGFSVTGVMGYKLQFVALNPDLGMLLGAGLVAHFYNKGDSTQSDTGVITKTSSRQQDANLYLEAKLAYQF